MASRHAPPCTHELRPGTAVCLRCQHAERAVKRARQRRLIARGAAATLVLGVIAAVGIAGATAIRSWIGTKAQEAPSSGDVSASGSEPTGADSTTGVVDASAQAATLTNPATPRKAVAPLVPVGNTELPDTMVAERTGDTVRVRFDLALKRTRRADKFEVIMRSTLPQVYGAPADSALRALPFGAVARAGDLTTTLPEDGLRIPLAGGRAIAVWPETRMGRDGPLVVGYRAVVAR